MGKPQSNFQHRTIFGVPLIAGNKLVEGIKAKGLEAQKILWDEIQLSTLNRVLSAPQKQL